MIYTVTLNPSLDYVMTLDKMMTNGVNRSVAEDMTFGGKGINVSYGLLQWGVETKAIGFSGGFTGEKLEQILAEKKIPADFIRLSHGDTRINVKVRALVESELNARGPEIAETDMVRLMYKLKGMKKGDVLVLAGSIPGKMSEDTYEKIIQGIEDNDIQVVVDTSGDALLSTLPHKPFLIKPNIYEVSDIFGYEITEDDEIEGAARELQSRGARNVLISMGEKGALLLDEKGEVHRELAPMGIVKNTVGAGDSMIAGFLAGWMMTRDYDQALRMAVAAGSASAFHEELATREQIQEVLQQM